MFCFASSALLRSIIFVACVCVGGGVAQEYFLPQGAEYPTYATADNYSFLTFFTKLLNH